MRTSKFKVGDPVKVITKRHGDEQFGKTGTVAEIGQLGDLDIEISYDEPFGCLEKNQYASRDLELVDWDHDPRKAKPEHLKIESGRHYKTRDGRKVGPMRNACGRYYSTREPVDGIVRIWQANGGHGSEFVTNAPNLDLIAEWTSSCAAAQADNLRDEYGPVVKPAAAGNDNGKPLTLGDILAAALQKPKFKVGDKLRWNSTSGEFFTRGSIYEVAKSNGLNLVITDNECPNVGDAKHGAGEFWLSKNFTRVTPAIVCLIENGQPKPSTYPHVHPSRGHAGDEAARLARKYPGKEFGVYELVDTRQVAEPTYAHEWQRLAADGEKIYAIKELRGMTGMTLKGAKEAVEHWLAVGEPYSRLAA